MIDFANSLTALKQIQFNLSSRLPRFDWDSKILSKRLAVEVLTNSTYPWTGDPSNSIPSDNCLTSKGNSEKFGLQKANICLS